MLRPDTNCYVLKKPLCITLGRKIESEENSSRLQTLYVQTIKPRAVKHWKKVEKKVSRSQSLKI